MVLNEFMYFGAIVITVISTLLYHVAQNATPTDVNPMISLFITYLSAALMCLGAYPFFKQDISFINEFKKVNWAGLVLGFAVWGIEIGFLYAYRTGWNISKANI